jgi:hypothetical protein
MSKKQKPPYLLPIASAEQSALLLELFQKAAVQAPQAHILAAMWSNVERCAAHFKPDGNGDAS